MASCVVGIRTLAGKATGAIIGESWLKVVVVDDDNTVVTYLRGYLSRQGHEVVAYEDPEAALAAMIEVPPPMVILDWNMPKLQGVEVCQRLRRRHSSLETYIIMLTARKGADNLAEALAAGADDFITKPFEPVELRARIAAGHRIVSLQRDFRSLSGFLPICAWCRMVRNQQEEWVSLEQYVEEKSGAQMTHGMCRSCSDKLHQRTKLSG